MWSNATLTLQRTAEPYLPIVVAVENLHKKSITIDRGSFWLSDLDDILYFMPSVKEVRKNYDKIVMDYRMVSYAGIPWENWRWTDRLERANFFPDLRSTWGATVRDHVTLRHRHAMVNLLYFERPRNLQSGRPFFLNVHPKGWEIPIRIRFVEDRVDGSGGCNSYFGTVTGETPGRLEFSAMGTTMMTCSDPVMDLERQYLRTLARGSTYGFSAGRLVIGPRVVAVIVVDDPALAVRGRLSLLPQLVEARRAQHEIRHDAERDAHERVGDVPGRVNRVEIALFGDVVDQHP